MKKFIIPILIFIVTFLVTYFCQRYTFANQEALGLFLWTPDYLRETFEGSWPISSLISAFLVQYYRINFFAEAVTAAMITLIFLNCRTVVSRFGVRMDMVCAFVSGLAWFFIARAESPRLGVITVILTALCALLSVIVAKKRNVKDEGWAMIAAAVLSVATWAVVIGTNEKIRTTEAWGQVEIASTAHNWDSVLDAATPVMTAKENLMLPYALLALNGKGQLSARMNEYPVHSPADLDTEGLNSRRAYQFSNVLYECLGCPNEAMHQAFQAACFLPHTNSFRTLRQLVIYNYTTGDYSLVRKYCEILSHSTNHKSFIKKYEKLMAEGEPRDIPEENQSYEAGLITHNQQFNIVTLRNAGIETDIAMDRFRAYLMFE